MANEYGYSDELDDGSDAIAFPAALRHPFAVLRRHGAWVLTSLILLLAITAGLAVVFPLKYEARATISLTAKSIPDEYVPTTVMANILEQFEAIRGEVFSRDSLSKIVVDTGLYADQRDRKTLASLAMRLGRELRVDQISRQSYSRAAPHSVAFAIKFAGEDPEQLAKVVNVTVSEMIDANVEYRSRQARVTTRFMQREFDRADAELREHQRELAEFRMANRGALPEEQAGVMSKLERLEDQRRSAILRISDHEARLGRIRSRPETLTDTASLTSLRARLQAARAVYTDDHPTVISLERQLAELGPDGGAESDGDPAGEREEVATIEAGIALEQRRLTQIDEEVKTLEARVTVAPTVAEEYDALLREDQILRESYVEYLRKLKNAELALSLESAQQGAQLTRLDSALAPTDPVYPRWMVAAAGTAASIFAALALAFLREFLFPVVIDEEHLESLVPMPCIGSISDLA